MGSLFRSDDSEIGPLSLFEKHILPYRCNPVTVSVLLLYPDASTLMITAPRGGLDHRQDSGLPAIAGGLYHESSWFILQTKYYFSDY